MSLLPADSKAVQRGKSDISGGAETCRLEQECESGGSVVLPRPAQDDGVEGLL